MNGILVIDKPKGWTSHDVVNKARRIFGEKRIGHTGTLDPLATGVLVLCIGKATKLVRYLESDDKEYTAELKLGSITDTQDADGRVLEVRTYTPPKFDQVREVLHSFQGNIQQQPPAFSALKVNGVPSHRLARQGTMKEHKRRTVEIRDIRLLNFADPIVRFSVCCSKGTYVRTLCSDIGSCLGMGAHLISLVRTRSGHFILEQAHSLERIADLVSSGQIEQALIPLNTAFSGFPEVILDEDESRRIAHGNAVYLPENVISEAQSGPVRIMTKNGQFLAMARIRDNRMEPEAVLV